MPRFGSIRGYSEAGCSGRNLRNSEMDGGVIGSSIHRHRVSEYFQVGKSKGTGSIYQSLCELWYQSYLII